MNDKTQQYAQDLIDLIDDSDIPVEVSNFEISEYWRGDPSDTDTEASGAEIEIMSFFSYENDDDENDFRIK